MKSRTMTKTPGMFAEMAKVPLIKFKTIEGTDTPKGLEVRPIKVGDQILMLHVIRRKGVIDPWHKHMDHESMGYLIRGKLHLKIGGEELVATPGTCWVHPAGVDHWSEALEECEQLEIKSPPTKTWVAEDD